MLHHIALTLMRGITQAQTLEMLRSGIRAADFFDHPDAVLEAVPAKTRQRLLMALAEHRSEALQRAELEIDFCDRHGIQILPYGSTDYPQRLTHCSDAPAVLYYKGAAQLNAKRVVAVVGTRGITTYGKSLCNSLCRDLAQHFPDALVVSGLAYGVDIHAHRACLEHGLSTVGVVAHGLDQIYPPRHRDSAKAMLERGGLLTEYVSQTRPIAGHFVRRNRIVAGMTDATIVVESASKGGALITAALAADYDRAVFAFPGKTTDEASAGCNKLIRTQRAQLITSADDLLEAMGWEVKSATKTQQLELFPELPPEQAAIFEALRKNESLQAQQLMMHCQLSHAVVSAALFEMEMSGLVKLMAGGFYRLP